jgi:hypothetical protein
MEIFDDGKRWIGLDGIVRFDPRECVHPILELPEGFC